MRAMGVGLVLTMLCVASELVGQSSEPSARAWALNGSYFVRATFREHAGLMSAGNGDWVGADSIEWGPGHYRTRMRALWNARGLFLRFEVTDPSPWSTETERDAPLWEEEVVEIFLDLDRSGTHYAEVELSPANVICDVRMIQGSPDKRMDLAWNLRGIESRVYKHIEPDGEITGWTGVLFLPWEGFGSLPSATDSIPPAKGDRWRFNAYRIERPGGAEAPERDVIFSPWSPTGEPSFHVPASFQDFVFVN